MLDGGYRVPEAPDEAAGDARAWRALAGVSAGDHVCCSYCDVEDQHGLVRRFAVDALERGMRLTYLAHGSTEATVSACLAEAGVDVGARRAAGQLELRRARDAYLVDGSFDPHAQIGRLAQEVDGARAAGFPALAVTAEMGWAFDSGTDPERLVAYERAVGRIFEGGGIAALCQYDALEVPEELHARLAAAHALSIATGPAGTVATRGPASVAEQVGFEGLRIAGEIDAFSVPYLRARVGEHLGARKDLVLDLAELRFVDLAASRALTEIAGALQPGVKLVLEGPPRVLRRVLRLCRWDERPTLVLCPEVALPETAEADA